MKIKVRICELQKGDRIEMDGRVYLIRGVTDNFFRIYQDGTDNYTTRQRKSQMFVYKLTEAYELLDNARIEKREAKILTIDSQTRPWVGKEHRIGSM